VDLVSSDSNGVPGNASSFTPLSLSADGRWVLFYTRATNLGGVDSNGKLDVYLRDCQLGQTTLISRSMSGGTGNEASWNHDITPDARFIVFQSTASDLVTGDNNGRTDAFLLDRSSGILEIISRNSSGTLGSDTSEDPAVTPDGRFVAFDSRASNLVAGDTNGRFDIFVRDRQNGTTTRVSVDSNGAQANHESFAAEISANGRFVVYYSHASNLVPGDSNGHLDIFLHDRSTQETRRISVHSDGSQGNGDSIAALISDDGRYIGFTSYATNLVDGDTTPQTDVFRHDVLTGKTIRINVSSTGEEDNQGGMFGAFGGGFTPDARLVAFNSWGTNLVVGDGNGTQDVFLHELHPAPTSFCISTVNSTGSAAVISADGVPSVSDCSLRLRAGPLPNQTGLFFMGSSEVQIPLGNGFLCAGQPIQRFPLQFGAGQRLERMLDTSVAPGDMILSGSSWSFQAWFRDPMGGGANSNLSNGVTQTFCP
jgi:Tol biopolymer transport system component